MAITPKNMKTEGNSFKYFVDNKEVLYKDLQELIRLDMTVSVDGLNVYYKSPQKEIKTEKMNRLVEEALERQEQQLTGGRNKLEPFISMDVKYIDKLVNCKGKKCGLPNCVDCNTINLKEGILQHFQNLAEDVSQKLLGKPNSIIYKWGDIKHLVSENIDSDNPFTYNFNDIKLPKEDVGKKENSGKIDYSEIDFDILDLMANRFNANKHKYPKGNMLKPIEEKELLFALFRHLKKMIQPIDNDPETFEEHLSAILCNAQMVYQQRKLNKN